jgi:homoserine O-acetyltransferase
MDSFDVRDAGELLLNGSGARKPKLTFVGITSDWLFRPQDVRAAAQRFALYGFDAQYLEFQSHHGHDAFLAEPNALRAILEPLTRTPATSAVRSN